MPAKDAEKVVSASTRAMVLVDGPPVTPRVLREYVDDARAILIAGLKEAKRQGWALADLLAVLDPPKPNSRRGEAWAPPRSSRQ